MNTLDELISNAKDVIKSCFGLELKQSQLKVYSDDEWMQFCRVNNFNCECDGLFIPESLTAYFKEQCGVL